MKIFGITYGQERKDIRGETHIRQFTNWISYDRETAEKRLGYLSNEHFINPIIVEKDEPDLIAYYDYSPVDPFLQDRLDGGEGWKIEKSICHIHGTQTHFVTYVESGYNAASMCQKCIEEVIEHLKRGAN